MLLWSLCQSHCCVWFFFFDISFDIVGEGTRERYKFDCERSHNVGFNRAITSQTVPAKILATQLLERLETKKTTEIGQDWHLLHFGNGTITPEITRFEGSEHTSANIYPKCPVGMSPMSFKQAYCSTAVQEGTQIVRFSLRQFRGVPSPIWKDGLQRPIELQSFLRDWSFSQR